MNNYIGEARKRSQNLLIVEGKHEKDELFKLLFQCFPEMKISRDDIWIYGTDMNTDKYYYDEDFTGSIAIVIGSEGFGMSRLVKENCDFLVKIPMKGKITSLNASVSAGIVMYEVVKQRLI